MNSLKIIKVSWKQIFEDILSFFSIMYLSYLVLNFVAAFIFVMTKSTMFNSKIFNIPIYVMSFVCYIIFCYRFVPYTKLIVSDIIFNRNKQTDAIFLCCVQNKIFITSVYLISLKVKKKKYLHLQYKNPIDIAVETKINLYYTEKSSIIISWETVKSDIKYMDTQKKSQYK